MSRARLLAALLALVTIGTACTGGSDDEQPAGPTYAVIECPDDVASTLIGDVECGTLTVPENRELGTGTVRVFTVTLVPPHGTEEDDPILVVGSDIATRLNYAGISPLAQRTGRRVIFIDQRGVGHSTPSLACPPAPRPLTWTVPTGSSGWRARIAAATRRCYRTLDSAGIDIASYDIAEMAEDVTDLVRVLDLAPVDLISYGSSSRISWEVMRTEPDLLRAVVMDSPDLPGVDPRAHAARAAQTSFTRVLRWCASDQVCRTRYRGPATLFARAMDTLDAAPLPVRTTSGAEAVLDPALVVRLARRTVTDGASAGRWGTPAALPALFAAVVARDTRRLAEASTELLGTQGPLCPGYRPKCTPAHTVEEGVAHTVLCRDIAPFAAGRGPRPPRGALAEVFLRSWWWDTCADWPVPAAAPRTGAPVRSAVPTLLLVGGNGAPTPLAAVRAHARGLRHASIVVDPVQAHNVLGAGCVTRVRDAWLRSPGPLPMFPDCIQHRVEW